MVASSQALPFFERIFTIGDTKAVNKLHDRVLPLKNSFSCLVQICVVTILNVLERHILLVEKQLPPGVL